MDASDYKDGTEAAREREQAREEPAAPEAALMDAKQEYVWAVLSARSDKACALFATKPAAEEHLRRLGVKDFYVMQQRVWDESYLGLGSYLRQGRSIHATELH